MATLQIDPDAVFTRDKAAATLTEFGYPVTEGALATLAVRGGGPDYRRFGKRVLYTWKDLIEWAKARNAARSHDEVNHSAA